FGDAPSDAQPWVSSPRKPSLGAVCKWHVDVIVPSTQSRSLSAKSSKYSLVSLKPENTFLYSGGAPRGPQTIVILGRLPGASTSRSRETASTSLEGREYPTTTT